MGRRKRVQDNLIADEIVQILVDKPATTMQDAARAVGYSFKDLDKTTRADISKRVKSFIEKFYIGDPTVKRALVESVQSAGIQQAIDQGDLTTALTFANAMAEDPAVGLKPNRNAVEVKVELSDLRQTFEKADDLSKIIDIKLEE